MSIRTEEQVYERWMKEIKAVGKDLSFLLGNWEVYRKLGKTVTANPKIPNVQHEFFAWVRNVYFDHAILGIRRHLDKDRRSCSLARLLCDLARTPQVVTFERFKRYHGRNFLESEEITQKFESLAGKGALALPCSIPCQDLKRLENLGVPIRKFANKCIAHLAKMKKQTLKLRTEKIDECLDVMRDIFEKYHWLVAGSSVNLREFSMTRWETIFEVPWIPPTA